MIERLVILIISFSLITHAQNTFWTPDDSGPVTIESVPNEASAFENYPVTLNNENETLGTISDWSNILKNYGGPLCHQIPDNMTLCRNIGYDKMILPNYLQHENLYEATGQSNVWVSLANSQCHRDLNRMLCSLYAPVCIPGLEKAFILPCRDLCESVRDSCLPKLKQFSFDWPEFLKCDRFPENISKLCIEPSSQSSNRCSGCVEEPSYESVISSYCSADIVIKARIIGRFADERYNNGVSMKTIKLGPRMRIIKQTPGDFRRQDLMRYRRQQSGIISDLPKFAKIECDCPILDATFTNNIYDSFYNRNKVLYGLWIIMGNLSPDGQTVHVDFMSKFNKTGKLELKKALKQLSINRNEICRFNNYEQVNTVAKGAQENSRYIRRFVRRENLVGYNQKKREVNPFWQNENLENAFNSISSNEPKHANQRTEIKHLNLHIPEIEQDNNLFSVDNNDI